MQYPGMFDYVGLFSAAVMWNGGGVADRTPTLTTRLSRQFATAPQLYWIAIGKDDFLYAQRVVPRNPRPARNQLTPMWKPTAAHEWRNWRSYLVRFLPQLFKKRNNSLSKCRAA